MDAYKHPVRIGSGIEKMTDRFSKLKRRQLDESARRFPRDSASPRSGWVRAMREALGMSQAQLATRAGISRATVQKLELAEGQPSHYAREPRSSCSRTRLSGRDCPCSTGWLPGRPARERGKHQSGSVAEVGGALHESRGPGRISRKSAERKAGPGRIAAERESTQALAMNESEGSDATPLDPDEATGLIARHVGNRQELDTVELANIIQGEEWAFSQRHRELLSPDFIRTLHRRMFDETWTWAGQFWSTEKNIGIAPASIAAAVHQLCEDTRTQLVHRASELDKIVARFSHRLVLIHPFVNGNGRHSRLMANLLLIEQGAPRFSWGSNDLQHPGGARKRYLEALRSADAGDFAPLLAFVRS